MGELVIGIADEIGRVDGQDKIVRIPPPRLPGERVVSASVRQALASNGRLSASVDERGVVQCLRVEYRSKSGSTPSLSRAGRRRPN